ncbi:MAG: helix-turn-helix domain-containing protein [Bryobacteraceae bacterium]
MALRKHRGSTNTPDSLTLTPRETMKLTRFGLNYTYALLQQGEMPSIRVGKRFYIPKTALLKWLENAGNTQLSA